MLTLNSSCFATIFSHCDSPQSWQMTLQDPATPIMEGMFDFHNYLMFFLVLIFVFVYTMLFNILMFYTEEKNVLSQKFSHSSLLEIIWTTIPAVILVLIAIPSFALLYSLDELIDPVLTLKIIGHQWYWSYEYSDYATLEGGQNVNFDSYMVSTNDLVKGSLRVLEVDNRVVLPTNTHIILLVTAADVIHSWAVPSFAVKVDGCPGRLTQTALFIKREGVYYGQCSEICGVNHGFMPIVVRAVNVNRFTNWIAAKLDEVA